MEGNSVLAPKLKKFWQSKPTLVEQRMNEHMHIPFTQETW